MRDLKLKSLDSIAQHGALEFRRVFPCTCSNDTLLDVFCEASESCGYVVIERSSDRASAIKEFHNMFQCVIPGIAGLISPYGGDIIVNLNIATNVKHDYKLMTVVGPRKPGMQLFLRALESRLAAVSHFWVSRFSDSVHGDMRIMQRGSSSPITSSISESSNQQYKTEESAYYYFYKILTNVQYSIGSELSVFIKEFSRNPSPRPSSSMKKISDQIDKISAQLDSSYLSLRNPSSTLVNDLLPRVRPAVERFIFESLGAFLYQQYIDYFKEDDLMFINRRNVLRAEWEGKSLHEFCGVRKEYQFGFDKSISLLNQISLNSSLLPQTLLQRILSLLISVKTEVLTGTNGSRELESMDDIAPIFLYLVLVADGLTHPHALFHCLYDFMPAEERLETEGKTLALLEGAARILEEQQTE